MNGKSFFTVSNLGGGGSDKYRENVYLDLLGEQPILVNYYYIVKQAFASKWLRKIDQYNSINAYYSFIMSDMINTEGFIQSDYKSEQPFEQRTFLLDSGVRNFINDFITSNEDFDYDALLDFLSSITEDYLKFAERMKFDLVVGMDFGGKYPFKDGESENELIIRANEVLKERNSNINKFLALETVTFMKKNPNFSIKVLGTVHGNNPIDMSNYMDYLIRIQKDNNYEYFGYAIGGIASSKQLSNRNKLDWGITDVNINLLCESEYGRYNKRSIPNILLVSSATKIVRSKTDKWIHCLGAGAYVNILPMLLAGANSFDSQTPGRRAYDGNSNSSVSFDNVTSSISKVLSTKVKMNGEIVSDIFQKYYKLNEIDEHLNGCDCKVCRKYNVDDIKALYKTKNVSDENYYLARQLMNIHSIHQHQGLINMYLNNEKNIYEYLKSKNEHGYSDFLELIMKII